MRLDHVIATVTDLPAAHTWLLSQGSGEAWPPGPFWPDAITSGVALGDVNLELYQPLAGSPTPSIHTLVFAPESLATAEEFLQANRIAFRRFEKVEPNPDLLALRGFPEELRGTPQAICTNVLPENPPYPFFFCAYAPFLRERLAPESFASPHGPLIMLKLATPTPEFVRAQFGTLGLELALEIVFGETSEVLELGFSDGTLFTIRDLVPV